MANMYDIGPSWSDIVGFFRRNSAYDDSSNVRVDEDAAKKYLQSQGVQTLQDVYNNRDANMREAYSPSAYMDGQGTPGYSQTQRILGDLAAVDAEKQRQADFLEQLRGGGNDPVAAAAAAAAAARALQEAIDKINEDYGRQVVMLGQRRDQGAQSIANALQGFRTSTAANNELYSSAATQISDAIAARLAQSMAEAQSNQQESARRADQLGWNGAAIQANAANNTTALQNSIRYQQDLADRYRQVQTASQNQTANAGELMNQGALGRLATEYQGALGAADQARSDAMYSARTQGAGGGGGGGGGGMSVSQQMRDTNAALDLWDRMSGSSSIDPQMAYLYKMFEADPNGFAANPGYQQYLPQMGDIAARNMTAKLR